MFSVIHVSQQTYFGASLAFGDLSVLNRQHWKSLFVLLPFSHFIRRYEQKTAATIHTTDKNPIQSESKLQLDLQKIMLENLCYEIHRKKEKKTIVKCLFFVGEWCWLWLWCVFFFHSAGNIRLDDMRWSSGTIEKKS